MNPPRVSSSGGSRSLLKKRPQEQTRERKQIRKKHGKSAAMSIAVSALPLHDAVQLFFPEEVHRYKSSCPPLGLQDRRMSDEEEDEDRERERAQGEREQMMAGCTHW